MNYENQDFIPSFCPNPECRFHHNPHQDRKWFVRYSSFFSRKENRQVQRYMCLGCNKTFSKRTFASDYCLKLDLEYEQLFAGLREGMDAGQWANAFGHSVSVIENRLKRLGRWLVCRGYLRERELLRMRDWGLVRLGLFFMRLWIKANCPKHLSGLWRCFLKELSKVNNVVAEEVWTLLSWCYWLIDNYFYRPAFTYS